MHIFTLMFQFNYSAFDMFRHIQVFILRKTCTCNFMVFLSCIHIRSLVDCRMCKAHPAIDQTAYMDA